MARTSTAKSSNNSTNDKVVNEIKDDMKNFNETEVREKFVEFENQLNEAVLDRAEVIRGGILATLTGNNIVQFGDPGTAKSYVSNKFAEGLNAQHFPYLLSKFTTPEELFGPISFTEMKKDRYIRLTTNKMPEAQTAFVDEIFKANSAILNSMLTVLNEHMYDDGSGMKKIPLITAFAASNEYPQTEELLALYDRFIMRFWVDYLSESDLQQLLKGDIRSDIEVTISHEELVFAQAMVKKVTISDEIINAYTRMISYLKKTHGIAVSDRRAKAALHVIKAEAWINGRSSVGFADIDVVQHIFWNHHEQQGKIQEALTKMENPVVAEIRAMFTTVTSKFSEMKATDHGSVVDVYQEVFSLAGQIKELATTQGGVVYDSNKNPVGDKNITGIILKTRTIQQEIHKVGKDLGIFE